MPLLQRDLQDQLREQAQSQHQQIATLARSLDPEQLVRRPASGGWSVGEVLEHLCLADETYAKPVATLIHRAHVDAAAPLREWRPSLLGKIMVNALQGSRRLRAPKGFRPGPTPRNAVVEDFLGRDTRLLRRMEDSASLDWNDLRFTPPSFPVPVFKINVGDAFRLHVVHVGRHLVQMVRLVEETRTA